MRHSPLAALTAIISLSALALAESTAFAPPAPALSLPLLHRAFGQKRWTKRGTLNLQPDAGIAELVAEEGVDSWAPLEWNESDEEGHYQLAVGGGLDGRGTWDGDEWEGLSVVYLPKCVVEHAEREAWEESLTVFLDAVDGAHALAGINYQTSADCNAPSAADKVVGGGNALKVKVDLGYDPEPVHWNVQKPGPAVVVGTDGKIVPPPPEKSFLEKYWLYLIPIVLVLAIGGGEEPKK